MSSPRCNECSHGKRKSLPAAMDLSTRSSPSENPATDQGESSSRTPLVSLPYVCNVCVRRHAEGSVYQYLGERREGIKMEVVRKGVDLEEEEEVVVKKIKIQAVEGNVMKVKKEIIDRGPSSLLKDKEECPKTFGEDWMQDTEGNVMDKKTSFDLPLDMQESVSTKLESEGKDFPDSSIDSPKSNEKFESTTHSSTVEANPDLAVSPQTSIPGAALGTRLTFIKDRICPFHAEKTLPPPLILSSSNTCRRVLTKEELHPDVTFGPYMGSFIKPGSVQEQDMRGDGNIRNWMYLVRITSDDALANLRICVIRGKVYYRTIRPIPRNAELLLKSNNY